MNMLAQHSKISQQSFSSTQISCSYEVVTSTMYATQHIYIVPEKLSASPSRIGCVGGRSWVAIVEAEE